jgi:rhamnogalacturonan hydrolase
MNNNSHQAAYLRTRMLANVLPLLLFVTHLAQAQLTASVGPTTPLTSKSNICNVLDYGASIGCEDIGPAITSAFYVRTVASPCLLIDYDMLSSHNQNCVKNNSGSTLYVPEG